MKKDFIDTRIESGILADLLSNHRAEMFDMMLTEYDEQRHMAYEREEGREKGGAEGTGKCFISLVCRT